MTQKPRKSDFGELKKKKKFTGCMPRTPLEAYAFDARFGKRSVFILDPRLIWDTPDFTPYLPVYRLESKISRLTAKACRFL